MATKKKQIRVQEVLKVIDIHKGDLGSRTRKYLSNVPPRYTDYNNNMAEDMHSVAAILENEDEIYPAATPSVITELKKIEKLCNKHDAAYFRLVIF